MGYGVVLDGETELGLSNLVRSEVWDFVARSMTCENLLEIWFSRSQLYLGPIAEPYLITAQVGFPCYNENMNVGRED